MKKSFKVENLCCAHCAEKMERASEKIEGVNSVKFNFMMQKVKVDAEDERFWEVVDEIGKVVQKIERDCKLVR